MKIFIIRPNFNFIDENYLNGFMVDSRKNLQSNTQTIDFFYPHKHLDLPEKSIKKLVTTRIILKILIYIKQLLAQ